MNRDVSPWFICFFGADHLYETCPGYRASNSGKHQVDQSAIDPDGFGVCGWCRRVWHSRNPQEVPA